MGLETQILRGIPLDKLTLWDKNFRNITPEAFCRLKNKIQELGIFKPLLAIAGTTPDTYQIIGGNQRLKAYRELGYSCADIIFFPNLTDKKIITKIALADNQSDGTTDLERLSALLADSELSAADLADYAIAGENISLKDLFEEEKTAAEVEEVALPEEDEIKPRAKEGQIWRLGEHFLIWRGTSPKKNKKHSGIVFWLIPPLKRGL